MEMPLYHRPNARTIGLYVWRNTLAFIKKAGTFIVMVSAIVWVLSSFPGSIRRERAGVIGTALEPVGALMGLGDWRLLVALVSSFVAKENSVATLGVLFGGADAGRRGRDSGRQGGGGVDPGGRGRLPGGADDLRTLCGDRCRHPSGIATLVGRAISVGLMLVVAFVLGVVVYQVGSLF